MKKRKLTKELLFKHLVFQQMTIKQIAKRYGLAESTISNYIKKFNIDVKTERNKYITELKTKQVKPVNTMNVIGLPGVAFYTTKRYDNQIEYTI